MTKKSPLGTAVSRVDGPLKVTGGAKYAADHHLDNLVHGYVVVSSVAHGTVREMDVDAAESAPGVLGVYTPFDPLEIGTGPNSAWAPLQDKEVTYHGMPIGLVVAETFEQARDAALTVRAEYDLRPVAHSLTDNLANAVVPKTIDNEEPAQTYLADGVGSIDEALAASARKVEARYTTSLQGHASMEPHSAVAVWRGGSCTVYIGHQGTSFVVDGLAGALGVDPARVRVIGPFVGGSFGSKLRVGAHAVLAAAAARALDRPVKVVLTREQTFTATTTRPGTVQDISLGANADGTLTAMRHDAWSGSAVLVPWTEPSAHRTTRSWYRSENIAIDQKYVPLNLPTTNIMRAPGEATGAFALETAMDELAVELGMDPIALRLKNYATVYPGRDVPWSSKHLDECYSVGAEKFGWQDRNPVPRGTLDGDWYVGTGMATASYPGFRRAASIKVRLRSDGTAAVSGSTADLGTGMLTVLAIAGADGLGIPLDRIEPELGDSDLAPAGFVGGSCGTATVTPAVLAAADLVKQALLDLAVTHPRSPFHGLLPSEVRYRNGDVKAKGLSTSFGALLREVGSDGIEEVGAARPGDEVNDYAFASFGAQFCEVRVNRWTGEPRVSRLLGVMDGGRIINAKAARSQILGGMLWGVSAALHEALHVEESGRLANATFADYLVPVNADIPSVDVHFLDYPDTVSNPLGARGIGELGIVGMSAAVGNAVFHATGKRVRQLPITIEDLL
jgi:xanthine dehydrogenase YagR molybdenum-binding subunit